MKILQMCWQKPEDKFGPYPQDELIKMIEKYEKYKTEAICPQQYKRLENIAKTARIALDHRRKHLSLDDISKKLKVSRVIAKSYLDLIYLETVAKRY